MGYKDSKSYTLKKDEFVKILVKNDNRERVFSFRWTLFRDSVLVVHKNFNNFVAQHMLYLNKNNSFKTVLLDRRNSIRDDAYFIVSFKKFNEVNGTAVMDLFLYDRESRVKIEFLTPVEIVD